MFITTPPAIVEEVEEGTHRNFISKEVYRGNNQDILMNIAESEKYTSQEWLTFIQGKESGMMVRKGEKGVRLVRFGLLKGAEKKDDKAFFRGFTVFNLEQFVCIFPKKA